MLALMRAERPGERGVRCGVDVKVRTVLDLQIPELTLTLPLNVRRRDAARCIIKADGELRTLGVRRVIYHRDFPLRGLFTRRGFLPADSTALLRAKAADAILYSTPRRERVLIYARFVTGHVLKAAEELTREFRYIATAGPVGVAEAIGEIGESRGAAVTHLARDHAAADAAIFFDPPLEPIYLAARCRYLDVMGGGNIYGGAGVRRVPFTLRARGAVPPGYDGAAILSAALEAGRARPGDIRVPRSNA